jgi:hypothetical protein
MQRSPRVRIAPRFYDVRIAEQHGSHDASAWATHPRPFPTIRVVSPGLGLVNRFARMALWSTHFLACASDAGQSARSGSRVTNRCFTSAPQLGPPLRHLCCVMAFGRAGLATGAAGNSPWRQLFLHAAPRPHSPGAHYKAWAAPSRGGNNSPSPLATACSSVCT